MENPKIKTKVVHSQSKTAWNVIGEQLDRFVSPLAALSLTLSRACFVKAVSAGKESFNKTSFESFNKIWHVDRKCVVENLIMIISINLKIFITWT